MFLLARQLRLFSGIVNHFYLDYNFACQKMLFFLLSLLYFYYFCAVPYPVEKSFRCKGVTDVMGPNS
jgi:hypothetical protein